MTIIIREIVDGMSQALVAFKENGRDFAAADIEKRDRLPDFKGQQGEI